MTSDESCACIGCGKRIEKYQSSGIPGDDAVEFRVGKVLESQVVDGKRRRGRPRKSDETFRHESTWGIMHTNCFLRAIEVPDTAFAGFGS